MRIFTKNLLQKKGRTRVGGLYESEAPDTFEGHTHKFTRDMLAEIENNKRTILSERERYEEQFLREDAKIKPFFQTA